MIRFVFSILVLLAIGSPALAIGGRSVAVSKTVVRGGRAVSVQKVVAAPVRVQKVRVHGVQQQQIGFYGQQQFQQVYAQPVQQIVVPQQVYVPQQQIITQPVQAGCSCLYR